MHLQHPATALFTMELVKGSSFRYREYMNETELSKHVCNLKDHGPDNNLSLEIHKKTPPYQRGTKRCDLLLTVNVSIICADPDTLLNKRIELSRRRNKCLLANMKK